MIIGNISSKVNMIIIAVLHSFFIYTNKIKTIADTLD